MSQRVTFPISSHYHHHHLPPPPLHAAATTAIEPPGECPLLGQARASSSIPPAPNAPNNSTTSPVPNPSTMPPTLPIKPPTAPRHRCSTPPWIPPQLCHVTAPQRHQQCPSVPPPDQMMMIICATSPPKIRAGGDERSQEGGIGKDARGGRRRMGREMTTTCSLSSFPEVLGHIRDDNDTVVIPASF